MSTFVVDPGKRSGYALFDAGGTLTEHGILYFDEMLELLRLWPFTTDLTAVVFEDFRLDYRAAKQKGSSMEASQIIGALKLFARTHEVIAVPQRTESRDLGYAHSSVKKAGSHDNSHDRDAIAHGWWYLETQRVEPSLGEHRHLRVH